MNFLPGLDFQFLTDRLLLGHVGDYKDAFALIRDRRATAQAQIDDWKSGKSHSRPMTESAMDSLRSSVADEIVQRKRLDGDFYPAVAKEQRTAIDAAFKELEAAKDDVRAKLLKVGYVVKPEGEFQSLTEDMVRRHPRIHALRIRYDAFAADSTVSTAAAENLKELAKLEAWLTQLKSKVA